LFWGWGGCWFEKMSSGGADLCPVSAVDIINNRSKPVFDSYEFLEAFKMYTDILKNYATPETPSYDFSKQINDFGTGKAARLDGCTRFEALVKVLLLLSEPAIVSGGIVSFLLSWNEFLFAFILTSTQARTVTVHIANAVGLVVLGWPAMTAMSTITIIPSLIFIAIAQKQIIRGLTVKAW
jgi:hypothetical protein